jgi:hypothetical protein
MKALSYSFYNPTIKVECEWLPQGDFVLSELKTRIEQCVAEDDDVLTQFIEADHLIRLVKQARHFEDIYMVLQDAIYNYEDDDSPVE